jgi:putative endonuclease
MKDKRLFVYILASKRNGTLYVGVTSDLVRRVWQHKNHFVSSFTKKYHVTDLVYFEEHPNAESAISRERQIKRWRRAWKLELIEKGIPTGVISMARLREREFWIPDRAPPDQVRGRASGMTDEDDRNGCDAAPGATRKARRSRD